MSELELSSKDLDQVLGNPEELECLLIGVSEVICEFTINFDELTKDVIDIFVKKMWDDSRNKSYIRSKTGITRGVLQGAIERNLKKIRKKPTTSILKSILNEINTYTSKHRTSTMPKHIFYQKIQKYNNGEITIKARIDLLKESGLLHEKGDQVYIKYSQSSKQRSDKDYLRFISENTLRLISTIIYNKRLKNKKLNYYQMTPNSTLIPPSRANEVRMEMNRILRSTHSQMIDMLTKYELDVPPGTFRQIGAILCSFDDNNNEE